MTTRNFDATTNPTNVVAAQSLSIGTRYAVQNVDESARLFVREAAVKPTGGSLRGFIIPPSSAGTFTPETGVGVWLWTYASDGCKAVIGPAS